MKDANAALDTMTPDAHVNHVPVLTGGVGKEELREFYSKHFIPKMPADTEIVPISRTIGSERLVDEMIIRFTHTIEIDWCFPVLLRRASEWNAQPSRSYSSETENFSTSTSIGIKLPCLCSSGFWIPSKLPVVGVETARKVVDPTLPSNRIMRRAGNSRAS